MDRDQQFLLPPDMREWLPASDPVWLVMRLIEQLDTSTFHVGRRVGGVGRAGYDPDMLLALLVWAWMQGEHSSRRIERLCGRDVSFRVICAGDAPDHATIARFRQGFAAAVEELFVEVLVLCRRLGLGQVGVVAVDGTKIAAPASQGANRTAEGLRKAAEAEQQRTAARRAARDAARRHAENDAAEDARFGAERGDEMTGEMTQPGGGSSREARIAAAIAELEVEREQAEAEQAARNAARQQRVRAKGVVWSMVGRRLEPRWSWPSRRCWPLAPRCCNGWLRSKSRAAGGGIGVLAGWSRRGGCGMRWPG